MTNLWEWISLYVVIHHHFDGYYLQCPSAVPKSISEEIAGWSHCFNGCYLGALTSCYRSFIQTHPIVFIQAFNNW